VAAIIILPKKLSFKIEVKNKTPEKADIADKEN